jgi:hypothetical protein
MIVNIAKLNRELSTLKTEKAETAVKLSAYDEEKAKMQGEIAELKAKLKTLEEKRVEEEEKKVEAKKEEAAVLVAAVESVDQKVVQKLAAIGIPEGTVKEEAPAAPVDPVGVYKTFDELKGKEKIDFFKKNERVILGAMKQMHFTPVNKVNLASK